MKEKVFSIIREHELIKKDDNIVVGVSGGHDSMALLYVLLDLKAELDFNILVAHVNHGVRGEEAKKDQLFVEKQCEKLKLPYYTKNVDMIRYGEEMGISSEEAGRELRYGFFREILRDHGGGKIAVAHNKNDQAETIIMRFMRGTGIDGLKGMEFKSKDIIRPILAINRYEIENYIENKKIKTVLDKTNLQAIYTRNKVRLELLPYIEDNFNPNIIDTIWRLGNLAGIDSDFLEDYTKRKYKEVLMESKKNSISLDAMKLLGFHRSIQQRIIRNAIESLRGSLQGVSEVQILAVLNLLIKGETGKRVDLSNNILVRLNYNELIIEKDNKEKIGNYSYELSRLEDLVVDELDISIHMEIMEASKEIKYERSKLVGYFDLDKIKGNLNLRNRKPGDRFVPFGMKGSKKIKDYFIDEKIGLELRDKIPLITDKDDIMWVVGYRTSGSYKIDEKTKKILKISIKYLK